MLYLPTFAIKMNQIWVNIGYMDGMGELQYILLQNKANNNNFSDQTHTTNPYSLLMTGTADRPEKKHATYMHCPETIPPKKMQLWSTPIASMGLVYLPTFIIKSNHPCR